MLSFHNGKIMLQIWKVKIFFLNPWFMPWERVHFWLRKRRQLGSSLSWILPVSYPILSSESLVNVLSQSVMWNWTRSSSYVSQKCRVVLNNLLGKNTTTIATKHWKHSQVLSSYHIMSGRVRSKKVKYQKTTWYMYIFCMRYLWFHLRGR